MIGSTIRPARLAQVVALLTLTSGMNILPTPPPTVDAAPDPPEIPPPDREAIARAEAKRERRRRRNRGDERVTAQLVIAAAILVLHFGLLFAISKRYPPIPITRLGAIVL